MYKLPLEVHICWSRLLLPALLAAVFSAVPATAQDKSAREQELRQVLQKIERLKEAIDVKEDSKSQYIKQLKSIEREIGAASDLRPFRAGCEIERGHRRGVRVDIDKGDVGRPGFR